MVSSPRIDFNSLWILKGGLSATFADPFELITINFLNGDQPEKGDTLIKVGRSSAFLLLATEAALCKASLPRRVVGRGQRGFFFIHEGGFMIQLQGSPPATEPNQGDTLRGTPALCQGYPGAILPAEGLGPLLGLTRALFRVAPHGKQGAHTVGVGLSIIPSTGGLRWIEVEDSVRSGWDDSAGKEVRIEDKARWRERDVAHVPERGSSWATPCFSRLLRHAQYEETPNITKGTMKSIKFFLTVYGMFFLCGTPTVVAIGLDYYSEVPDMVYRFLNLFTLSNSGMNFIIYAAMNKQFRQAFLQTPILARCLNNRVCQCLKGNVENTDTMGQKAGGQSNGFTKTTKA
ncbi:hypothetical protein PoB_001491600 [Plakobranchus ocellatus]|uniref:G-protein coupled receptors family 1 profile domain-containing protein n=1 Tax=Plakobranchus ocellatus TaxID=259542 RepID=A0AAV3YXZ5_9GAST|nr:hypothetical protein PoB_001491600 [Plakobranchus ocellatus]